MAKIVITRGTHPTETLAYKMAKQVYELLNRKGYNVELVEVPYKITTIYLARKIAREGARKGIVYLLNTQKVFDRWFKKMERKYPNAIFFDFHSTPLNKSGFGYISGARNFWDSRAKKPFVEPLMEKWNVVEIPAVYKPMPEKQISEIVQGREIVARTYRFTSSSLHGSYLCTTDEKATARAKYDIPFEKFVPFIANMIAKEAKTRWDIVKPIRRVRGIIKKRKEAKRITAARRRVQGKAQKHF